MQWISQPAAVIGNEMSEERKNMNVSNRQDYATMTLFYNPPITHLV